MKLLYVIWSQCRVVVIVLDCHIKVSDSNFTHTITFTYIYPTFIINCLYNKIPSTIRTVTFVSKQNCFRYEQYLLLYQQYLLLYETVLLIFYHQGFSDYCLHIYCYFHNVLANMSSGLLRVFVELGNLHGTRISWTSLMQAEWPVEFTRDFNIITCELSCATLLFSLVIIEPLGTFEWSIKSLYKETKK